MVTRPEQRGADTQPERRAQRRYPFMRQIDVVAQGVMFSAPTADLSAEGARIGLAVRLEPETPVALSMSLEGLGETPLPLTVGGQLVWQSGPWCGVRFVDPPPKFNALLQRLLTHFLWYASPEEVTAFLREGVH